MFKLKKIFFISLFILFAFYFSSCSDNAEEERKIEVSAASSLTDVLNEILMQFTKETDIKVELNYGSSSICARQIKEGKNSSIFISANEMWMEYLNDVYIDGSSKILLNNTLVIVAPKDSNLTVNTLKDLLDKSIGKIAMGDPSHVPAGIYGKSILEESGIWNSIKGNIVGAFDVRAAMALVETDSVGCGIIYKTDALASDKIKILYEIPMDKLDINYMISRFDNRRETLEFYDFLYNDFSRSVFEKYGFVTRDKA